MKNKSTVSMLLLTLLSVLVFSPSNSIAQNVEYNKEFTPANRSVGVSLEKNVLFYAHQRFQVTQQGGAQLNLGRLFDGEMNPSYTTTSPSVNDPTIIEIDGLPNFHTQQGAWVGWSTRYWKSTNFKIEGYNVYNGANTWLTIASESVYNKYSFMKKMPGGRFTKLRFTFYEADGTNGRLGVSELFYLAPEYVRAYDHLMVQYSSNANVGIGTTTTPDKKLTVAGTVKSREVIVEENTGADFVFEEEYELPDLSELEAFIKANGHLPEIPTAGQMKAEGVKVGELQMKLLQKIEELTLYAIQQQEIISKQQANIDRGFRNEKKLNSDLARQEQLNTEQQQVIEALTKRIEQLELNN